MAIGALLLFYSSDFLNSKLYTMALYFRDNLAGYTVNHLKVFFAYFVISLCGVMVWGHEFFPMPVYHAFTLILAASLAVNLFGVVKKGFPGKFAAFAIIAFAINVCAMFAIYLGASFLEYFWIHAHSRFLWVSMPLIVMGLSVSVPGAAKKNAFRYCPFHADRRIPFAVDVHFTLLLPVGLL